MCFYTKNIHFIASCLQIFVSIYQASAIMHYYVNLNTKFNIIII